MILDKAEDCCDFAISALDGVYGWSSEAIAIVIFVFVFNFLIKRLLRHLHKHFQKQNRMWSDSFVNALYKPLSYYVWFFAIIQTLSFIAANIGEELSVETRHMILSIGGLAAVTWFFLRWKTHLTQYLIIKSRKHEVIIHQGKIGAIDKLVTIAICFFSILALLEITHRGFNTIIAFGGVGGLALAFASQEVVSNFFGGFMIYLTQPFTVGELITIPDHKIEGTVEDIGWYMTCIRSTDKQPIFIPNSIFSKLVVITQSRMSHRQIEEVIGIRHEDMPKVKALVSDMKAMLEQDLDLDRSQPIFAHLSTFGQYSLDITISAYTQTIDHVGYLRIKENVLLNMTTLLDKHHVKLASHGYIDLYPATETPH